MVKTYIRDTAAGLKPIRDPMIMVVGDTYYLTGTQPPYWRGENAGMHLWSSTPFAGMTAPTSGNGCTSGKWNTTRTEPLCWNDTLHCLYLDSSLFIS